MASLRSPSLYPGKCLVGLSTLPFTTVEDDPYIAPVLKVPAQLLEPIQPAAGDYEEEHVTDPTSDLKMAHGGSRRDSPVIFRGVCATYSPLLLSHSGAGLGYG